MSDRNVLIRALEASGNDQGAALARAILPEQPAPTTGTAAPPDEVAARMAAATATPEGQAAVAASASGGHQSERDYYDAMGQEQLAALSDDEFRRALSLIKGP